ncbi:hypothetical protein LSPH24S_05970 [Lysinibacillus sphaericus]
MFPILQYGEEAAAWIILREGEQATEEEIGATVVSR